MTRLIQSTDRVSALEIPTEPFILYIYGHRLTTKFSASRQRCTTKIDSHSRTATPDGVSYGSREALFCDFQHDALCW